MKKSVAMMLVLAGICCWHVQSAGAKENQRFRGGVGLGVMAFDRGDNLDPNGSKRHIDTLDKKAERELTVIPLLAPFFSYDVGTPGGGVVQFMVRPPIEEAGGLVVNLGGTYYLPAGGSIQLNALVAPLEEAWENPYLVGERRSSTDSPKYGLHLAWREIGGTGLSLHGVYLRDEVDNDRIGDLLPELAREGAIYALAAEYRMPLSEAFEIKTRASYLQGDYDGVSNSFTRYRIRVQASYRLGAVTLKPEISYRHTSYDEIDPMFGITREEDAYGIDLTVQYQAPFGLQGWALLGMAGYGRGDNDIAFYETESLRVGSLLTYYF